jgi:hypothetical protein
VKSRTMKWEEQYKYWKVDDWIKKRYIDSEKKKAELKRPIWKLKNWIMNWEKQYENWTVEWWI